MSTLPGYSNKIKASGLLRSSALKTKIKLWRRFRFFQIVTFSPGTSYLYQQFQPIKMSDLCQVQFCLTLQEVFLNNLLLQKYPLLHGLEKYLLFFSQKFWAFLRKDITVLQRS